MVAKHHLDFVLCDPISTAIVAAIELDDKSHALDRRKRRDRFLNEAFAAANIPLIRIRAEARYDIAAISETIERHLATAKTEPSSAEERRRQDDLLTSSSSR
jgi:translation initiation factor 2 gamma subunit (eIF-2gamma)